MELSLEIFIFRGVPNFVSLGLALLVGDGDVYSRGLVWGHLIASYQCPSELCCRKLE